jgi:hypothetical protein
MSFSALDVCLLASLMSLSCRRSLTCAMLGGWVGGPLHHLLRCWVMHTQVPRPRQARQGHRVLQKCAGHLSQDAGRGSPPHKESCIHSCSRAGKVLCLSAILIFNMCNCVFFLCKLLLEVFHVCVCPFLDWILIAHMDHHRSL